MDDAGFLPSHPLAQGEGKQFPLSGGCVPAARSSSLVWEGSYSALGSQEKEPAPTDFPKYLEAQRNVLGFGS